MRPREQTARAYAVCEAITREQAANFYYGIRLLAGDRRRAMCAVYAFSRRVDDIGDGDLETAEKRARLGQAELGLTALDGAGGPAAAEGDPVMIALADANRRFDLPIAALGDLIAGVRMDVDGIAYESFDDLVVYCRRVAGAIGRVCLAIFGLNRRAAGERARAEALADDLGVALQLTNILRDLREDAENGRLYLPRQDLARFDLPSEPEALLAQMGSDDETARRRLESLIRFEAARAGEWFERGLTLAPMLDRRSAACVLAMAGIYRRLLERIEASPGEAVSHRMSLPVREKAWVAVRGMLGASP